MAEARVLSRVPRALRRRRIWGIRRDFEEDSTWFPEIDGVKIFSVLRGRHAVPQPSKLIEPLELLLVIGRSPGDMMHCACKDATRLARRNDIHQCC
jgi:hypothetical protein